MKLLELPEVNQSSIESHFGKNSKMFRLSGRLGNQLLGLSDAHAISKKFNSHIAVDLSEIITDSGLPEWVQFTESWKWLTPIYSKQNYEYIKNSSLFNVGSISSNLNYPDLFGYLGFSVSKIALDVSGLFKQGSFPFEMEQGPNFSPGLTAMSIRGDDYRKNPGLGVLSKTYYKKALFELDYDKSNPVVVFTDDPIHAARMLKQLKIEKWALDESASPLKAMQNLSAHSRIVMANSTFSYLACYFSNANMIISPKPFYLADPNWNANLILIQEKQIPSARFPKIRLLFLRILNRLYK